MPVPVVEYHERTKHHPYLYARSPEVIDWANEPDPFRSFRGAPLLKLPFIEKDSDANFFSLFQRSTPPGAFTLRNIAAFLELSMGLSAWKSYMGARWALRINPSSGNLHPTESYLVLPPLPENEGKGGVFHYNPFLHSLEARAHFGKSLLEKIDAHLGTKGFLAALTSIHWREAWKYGERAFRYSLLDTGHAAAAMSFSAALLGWKVTYLNSLSSTDIAELLGFHKTSWEESEGEDPEALFFVHAGEDVPRGIPEEAVDSLAGLDFAGEPNRLSKSHREWPAIDEAAARTLKPRTTEEAHRFEEAGFLEKEIRGVGAAPCIRRRRSAQGYDPKASASREDFFAILDKTVPRNGSPPFDMDTGPVRIHLLLFVHNVRGLMPGLYLLLRDEKELPPLKGRMRGEFRWLRPPGTPEGLPLYLLKEGDLRAEAAFVSCQQEIAGDGVFAVSMIARFKDQVEKRPHLYRNLHWEAGLIGHVLYLSAEAHGLRGTGMGCFFDDAVHELLGFTDNSYQALYNFTVGKPLEDPRLTTLPPYYHLKDSGGDSL